MAANARAADASLRHLLGEDAKQPAVVAGLDDTTEAETSLVAADDVADMDDPFADLNTLMERFSSDVRVKRALQEGVDLREYTKQVEAELKRVEESAVQDYMLQANSFADMHAQIRSCDAILEGMETVLSGFQTNLGSISSAIRHLQDESSAMSVKLSNRQAVSAKVAEFVQNAVIPEDMAKHIFSADVNEQYLDYLAELNRKMDFVKAARAAAVVPLAVQEVEPMLAKLKVKAVAKVREYLLQRIHALKKPRTNLQMLQHNSLSKFRLLNRFLQSHAPPVFDEVQSLYIETLSKLYGSYFQAYMTALLKLESQIATKYDLLATEPEKLKSWTDKFSSSRQVNLFALGTRDAIFQQLESDAIVPHEAAEKNVKFTYDQLFRSLNHYLLDCTTSEWLFCMDWFGPNDMFQKIFTGPLQLCLSSLSTHLKTAYDAVGLLIMLRINALNKQAMVKRGIPVLQSYFQRIDALIWPRFHEVFTANVASVKAFQVVPNSLDLRPHFVVRRYAEFVTSLLSLTTNFKHPEVIANLNVLREEMTALLERLANAVQVESSREKDRKRQIFLLTNLELILSLLREKEIVSTEVVMFEDKMETTMAAFVEAELLVYFKPLLVFVRATTDPAAIDKDGAAALIKSLHKTLKGDVQRLCQGILLSFSNFSLAGAICRKLLAELTRNWNRCWELIKDAFGPNAYSKFYVAPFQIREEFSANLKMLGDLGMQ